MAFKDTLNGASFRGVSFHIPDDTASGGREVVTHEYPGRDQPFHEDMGAYATRFEVEGIIIGDDAKARADDLERALGAPGAGRLIHPWYGPVDVVIVGGWRRRHRYDRGREVVVRFAAERAGANLYPSSGRDAATGLAGFADAAEAASANDLTSIVEAASSAGWSRERVAAAAGAVRRLADLRGPLMRTIDAVARGDYAAAAGGGASILGSAGGIVGGRLGDGLTRAASIARAGERAWRGDVAGALGAASDALPQHLGDRVRPHLGSVRIVEAAGRGEWTQAAQLLADRLEDNQAYPAVEVLSAMGATTVPARLVVAARRRQRAAGLAPADAQPMVSALLAIAETPSPETVQAAWPGRRRAEAAAAAVHAVGRDMAAVAAARLVPAVDWTDRNAAITARDRLRATLDAAADRAGAQGRHASWRALGELSTAASIELGTRAKTLPELQTVRPQAVVPALVLAQRLYGDDPTRLFARSAELTIRARARNPLSLPAEPVEVAR